MTEIHPGGMDDVLRIRDPKVDDGDRTEAKKDGSERDAGGGVLRGLGVLVFMRCR